MKKLISVILLLMMITLNACSGESSSGTAADNNDVSPSADKEITAAPDKAENNGATAASAASEKTETGKADSAALREAGLLTEDGAARLSFKAAASFDYLKQLDGKEVSINGYLATSSPADGSFIFLMNLPYQSCPFCVPNTSQLANTLEVYPKKGEQFGYTNQAVNVTGTLKCAPDSEMFTDDYGYEFNVKLVDAEYTILSGDELTEEMAFWQKVADSGIITDLYTMYDYVFFRTSWDKYTGGDYVDADGTYVAGYYFFDSDVEPYISYYYQECDKDGYFDSLAERLKSFDNASMEVLIQNVEKAGKLAETAKTKFNNGEYTYEFRYIEEFDTEDYVFKLNDGDEMENECYDLYYEFSDWIAAFEL